MSGKFALIIGNSEYADPGLAQLAAPGKDAEAFARVLADRELCAFDDVKVLLNEPHYAILEAIDGFFYEKKPDDLLILYFSGHGVRDELGALYLAVKNTNRYRLRSTAIKSDSVRELMDQSRSRRQILILDCCNSGAFAKGQKAATAISLGTASAFEVGYGRIILTASDSTQFAWEGDQVIGETENSLFTYFLMKGLEGEADLDCDGRITVDELYDYTYEQVKLATPKQTPSKFSDKQQGEIVLRQITRLEDIKPASLPEQLVSEIQSLYPEVRLRAIDQLGQLLSGKNLGLARSAKAALEALEAEDDSRRVAQAASQALEVFRQAELLALQKAEMERIAREKAEAEKKAEEEHFAREQPERDVIQEPAIPVVLPAPAGPKSVRANPRLLRQVGWGLGGLAALLLLGWLIWKPALTTPPLGTPARSASETLSPNATGTMPPEPIAGPVRFTALAGTRTQSAAATHQVYDVTATVLAQRFATVMAEQTATAAVALAACIEAPGCTVVSASKGMQSIGIEVSRGQIVTITYVQGRWYSHQLQMWSGPGGISGTEGWCCYVVQACPRSALVARIDDHEPYCVGLADTRVADSPGTIYLGINDLIVPDNRGYILVMVEVK